MTEVSADANGSRIPTVGGEEFNWDETTKMKPVFEEPQRLDMDLEQAWKYIFADMSEFFGEYHRQRGAVDIKISPWNVLERRKTPEFCRCRAIRKVEAVVPVPSTSLAHFIRVVPTKSAVVEYQFAERRNSTIEIRISTESLDVPYGKDFRIQAVITLHEVAANPPYCEVTIRVGVRFIKKPFLISKQLKREALDNARRAYSEWLALARQTVAQKTTS